MQGHWGAAPLSGLRPDRVAQAGVGRTFQLVRVAPGHGVGVAPTAKPDRVVTYTGAMLTVSLKQ